MLQKCFDYETSPDKLDGDDYIFIFFGGGGGTVPLTKNPGCDVSITFNHIRIKCGNEAKKLQNTLRCDRLL